eukprot:282056-Pyramimonas_sp.AAC.1
MAEGGKGIDEARGRAAGARPVQGLQGVRAHGAARPDRVGRRPRGRVADPQGADPCAPGAEQAGAAWRRRALGSRAALEGRAAGRGRP